MPRKELGAPDENRRRAERLFDGEEDGAQKKTPKKRLGGRITDYGCDRLQEEEQFSDGEAELSEEEDGIALIKRKKKKSAKEYAMALVSIKSYTEHALREKLKIRGYGCDETDEAIAYVKGFGYVNDFRLAQNAAEKLAMKPCGKRKIFAYLRQKGISGEVIDQIDFDGIDFKENAKAYSEKLAAKGKTKEQIARTLLSSGFSSAEISHALKIDFDIYIED